MSTATTAPNSKRSHDGDPSRELSHNRNWTAGTNDTIRAHEGRQVTGGVICWIRCGQDEHYDMRIFAILLAGLERFQTSVVLFGLGLLVSVIA